MIEPLAIGELATPSNTLCAPLKRCASSLIPAIDLNVAILSSLLKCPLPTVAPGPSHFLDFNRKVACSVAPHSHRSATKFLCPDADRPLRWEPYQPTNLIG